MQIQFSLIKKKKEDWTSKTLATPLPPPQLSLRPITSYFCLTPPLPSQSGSHMCITPDSNMQNSMKLKFELKFGT